MKIFERKKHKTPNRIRQWKRGDPTSSRYSYRRQLKAQKLMRDTQEKSSSF